MEVMRTTNIERLALSNPFQISGGQMQRVALASVIVLEPDVLIIDEPTSQLDPDGTESVFEVIKAMKQKHKTIILVEHKIDLIAEYADEVIAFKDGRIIANGPTAEVLSDMSLLEEGVNLPQVAMLGAKLRERGLALDHIPVTEKDARETISRALKERR